MVVFAKSGSGKSCTIKLEVLRSLMQDTEVIIIAGVVLVLFGSAAIPKFFRAIGKARSEFDKGIKDAEKEEKNELYLLATKLYQL